MRTRKGYSPDVGVDEYGVVNQFTSEGVTVQPFNPDLHSPESQSHRGYCAHGGQDTCKNHPVYSVTSAHWRISACPDHLFGAFVDARARAYGRTTAGIPS